MKFLSDRLHHGGMHLYRGAAELIDTDGDIGFAVDGNELALQAGKRSSDHAYLLAGTECSGVEINGASGMIYHETKLLHLCCRNDGGGMLAAEDQVAEYRGKLDDGALFVGVHMDEDHHGDEHPLYLFLPVTPEAQLFLHGQKIFDPRLLQPVAHLLLMVHLHVRCQPPALTHRSILYGHDAVLSKM